MLSSVYIIGTILGMALFIYLLLYNPALILILIPIVFIGVFLAKGIKILKEYERAIIFRLGKFHRVAGPGLVFIIPGIDRIYKIIDIRIKAMPFHIKKAYTSDGAEVDIIGVLYYRITNPRKAVLNVEDYKREFEELIESDIRDLIAGMTLKELFANVEIINDLIKKRLEPMVMNWGIDIKAVQIRRVIPAPEIAKMLVKRRAAEEWYKIRKMIADARRVMIKALGEGARYLDDRAVLYLYLMALQNLAQKVTDVDIFGTSPFLLTPPDQIKKFLKGTNLDKVLSQMGLSLPQAIAMITKIMREEDHKPPESLKKESSK